MYIQMQRIEKIIEHIPLPLPRFNESSQIKTRGKCGSKPFNNTLANSVVPTNTLYVTDQYCSCAPKTMQQSGFINIMTGYAAPLSTTGDWGIHKKVYYCS
jgi:hypothetical protein